MIVIHHNPGCGTSRNVLSIIEASGETPVIIDYLKEGCTRPQLLALFAAAGLTPRTALRETKSPARELGLLDDGVSDAVQGGFHGIAHRAAGGGGKSVAHLESRVDGLGEFGHVRHGFSFSRCRLGRRTM